MATKKIVPAEILSSIKTALLPHQFNSVKNHILACQVNDLIYIVQFYMQMWDSDSDLIITFNLGIISRRLARILEAFPSEYYPKNIEKKPDMTDSHWHWGIGNLMPERREIWWEIGTPEKAAIASAEMAAAVKEYGLPLFKSFQSTDDLIALWNSGRGPGIAEKVRNKYLSYLKYFTKP